MTNDDGTSEPDLDQVGSPICPKCLIEVQPSVDFCPKCRTPVTSFANTLPFEGAISKGWGLGEAVATNRPSLVTLIGVWLFFFPILLVAALLVFVLRESNATAGDVVMDTMVGGMFCLAGWCLYRVTRNYVIARRATEPSQHEKHEGSSE